MKVLLKSKLYQQEIYRWIVIMTLFVWAATTSVLALQNRKEILVVGIDQTGHAKLIEDKNDAFLQDELTAFLKEFLSHYYQYDETSFQQRIAKATDLFTEDLWNEKKQEILQINQKLKKEALTQSFEIEALDLIGNNRVEAVLNIAIRRRASHHQVKLRVTILFQEKERSHKNPWGYEIKELSSVAL